MVRQTNWTQEYCEDHLTVPRLKALFDEWKYRPSTNALMLMIATFCGYKPESPPADPETQDLAELMAMFPGGRIG